MTSIRLTSTVAVLVILFGSRVAHSAEDSWKETARVNVKEGTSHSLIKDLRSNSGKGEWREYPGNPVLSPGSPQEWDGGAIGSMSVVRVGDIIHMYYEGWAASGTGLGPIAIGHATSGDGIHWTKDSANPVLPPDQWGQWDDGGTWDPFVLYEDGLFKMWYGGSRQSIRAFEWGYAVSVNGSSFTRKGQISAFECGGEVEDIHVAHDPSTGDYLLYYWDRKLEPRGLYVARSQNETDFDFRKATPIMIEGEKDPCKFTHVFLDGGTWHMFYAQFIRPDRLGGRTGYATSSDGLHWKAQNAAVIQGQDAEVLRVEKDLYLMYYNPPQLFDSRGCDVRLAILEGSLETLLPQK